VGSEVFDFRRQEWNHYFHRADRSFVRQCYILLGEVPFWAFGALERGPIMTPVKAAKKFRKFAPQTFLSTIDGGRQIAAFRKKQTCHHGPVPFGRIKAHAP
jgi:hypothetical protein